VGQREGGSVWEWEGVRGRVWNKMERMGKEVNNKRRKDRNAGKKKERLSHSAYVLQFCRVNELIFCASTCLCTAAQRPSALHPERERERAR
jgi:hypothetical protein